MLCEASILQKIFDQLPLRRWATIAPLVCKEFRDAAWLGRPAQRMLAAYLPTSVGRGDFNELAGYHQSLYLGTPSTKWGETMKIYQPYDLETTEAIEHKDNSLLPGYQCFRPIYHGHGVGCSIEQICLDFLAWLQSENRFNYQFYLAAERVMARDMFTGADTPYPAVEMEMIMEQFMKIGEFGIIDNPGWAWYASTLIEHLYIHAHPPTMQADIRFSNMREIAARPWPLWNSHGRLPPKFDGVDCNNFQGFNRRADADLAQILNVTLIEKNRVIYDKGKLKMVEDAAFAKKLKADYEEACKLQNWSKGDPSMAEHLEARAQLILDTANEDFINRKRMEQEGKFNKYGQLLTEHNTVQNLTNQITVLENRSIDHFSQVNGMMPEEEDYGYEHSMELDAQQPDNPVEDDDTLICDDNGLSNWDHMMMGDENIIYHAGSAPEDAEPYDPTEDDEEPTIKPSITDKEKLDSSLRFIAAKQLESATKLRADLAFELSTEHFNPNKEAAEARAEKRITELEALAIECQQIGICCKESEGDPSPEAIRNIHNKSKELCIEQTESKDI